jgi:hypothetical protein
MRKISFYIWIHIYPLFKPLNRKQWNVYTHVKTQTSDKVHLRPRNIYLQVVYWSQKIPIPFYHNSKKNNERTSTEWVSDCCLTPTQQFSAILWREQVNFQLYDDEVRFVLDQHAELDAYSASSLKQQSTDRHVAPRRHIILIPSQPVFALYL